MRSWRSTDNALKSIAAAHSDGLLVLDEISMCDPRIIGETVYMLGNGTGKARANDRGQAGRQVQEWRLLFLSTGEKTLAQHMAEANKELKAGMQVRMLAVPADASKGLGMFDVLNGFEDAAALSDALKARVPSTTVHHSQPFYQRCASPEKSTVGRSSCAVPLKGLSPSPCPPQRVGKPIVRPCALALRLQLVSWLPHWASPAGQTAPLPQQPVPASTHG